MICKPKRSIGVFLKNLTIGLLFTIVLAAINPQLTQAHSLGKCWDGSLTPDLKSCPVEPKRLCNNGTLVPITQRYCSASKIKLQVLNNPLGEPISLLVQVEDGLVKSFRTLPNHLRPQVDFSDGKMILRRIYADRPPDWDQRPNHGTCPVDVVGVTCKKTFTSTGRSGKNFEINTFVETSYYPHDLTNYPEVRCMKEKIISHIEIHQSGDMPPLSIFC